MRFRCSKCGSPLTDPRHDRQERPIDDLATWGHCEWLDTAGSETMIAYQMEHIMSYTATLAAPEIIGEVPEGIRLNFYVTGGEVTGPKVFGKFRPVGADWLTIRRDGVAVLDVKATVETNDGALLYITFPGVID